MSFHWDEVEREFFVIGKQLHDLSKSFQALASALARERQSGTVRGVKGVSNTEVRQKKEGPASEPGLPF